MTIFKQNRPIALFLLIVSLLLTACGAAATDTATDTNAQSPDPIADTVTQAEVAEVNETNTELTETTTTDSGASADVATEAPQPEAVVTSNDTISEIADSDETEDESARPVGWSEETHSNDVDPNYDVVFPQDQVNTMTIVIDSADWQAMLDNMTELYGEAGVAGADEGGRGGRQGGGNRGGGPGGDGGLNVGGDENPDYVAATIEFDGDVWTNVGVRFKGNSTLTRGWNSGSIELPFKLDFDEFEDDYPEIDNQRFYGFKQLSLSSPSTDASYVRNALAYDVMQDAGLVAPETAWYELMVDYGEGPVSFGLYTVIEVVDDTVIETAFGDDDGNIYEGDGTASSLAEGTFDELADSFQKENNDEADYSDIEALYTVLHSDTRLTDAAQWRSDLETIFDVDTFLNWLAVNTVIVNWDTYGELAHNFYLYHDPESDLLTWIGWDYNESLQSGRRGGTASLSQEEESAEWPLIRYLLDDPIYESQYAGHIEQVALNAFDADTVASQLAEWQTMLAPHVADSASFTSQIETITSFVYGRQEAVETFLTNRSDAASLEEQP